MTDRPKPKCETCQDTQWICIVETDDGDFIEDTCPDCSQVCAEFVADVGGAHRWCVECGWQEAQHEVKP